MRPFLALSLALAFGPLARPAAPNPREAAALAILGDSAAPLQQKAQACHALSVVGTAAAVPALASLLEHEPLSDYARIALESIADPAAGKALRAALPKLEGRRLAGVIDSLGVRRDEAALRDLQRLALDPQHGAAAAAIAALGLIGTSEAALVLEQCLGGPAESRTAAAHAMLAAAGRLAQGGHTTAALRALAAIKRAFSQGPLAEAAERQKAMLAPPTR